MFESEALAECSVTAMLTFIGLMTQADDAGRHRDHPAIIAGRLWALRPEHTPTHVARDLEELATAGLICRFTGCDGRNWLHIVTWKRHQKIDNASAPRAPRCPRHEEAERCGKCKERRCPARPVDAPVAISQKSLGEVSPSPVRDLDTTVSPDTFRESSPEIAPADSGVTRPALSSDAKAAASISLGNVAGQGAFGESSTGPREGSGTGSRILDPGSVPTGRGAPAPDAASETVSAKQLVAEYASGCHRRPPSSTLGHLGREIKTLLAEDFEPGDIRTALDRLRSKGLHPSVLPSLVNEVVNASPHSASPPSSASGGGLWASSGSAYTPYLNTTPEPTTFGGGL
ncbi:hypothetical protein [Streptomyces sp. AK02-01A]|uniref:hypothetical protein n=1 Tax=Streptomyces sp. AK02-01A TaxID=3028648 RepID=UPI0029B175B0|nr:hypothetical protein [Streptomyces sp. AK02-01A]MDX3854871.1 hypothetical protein [Streptomyces sp. AK02-01A]